MLEVGKHTWACIKLHLEVGMPSIIQGCHLVCVCYNGWKPGISWLSTPFRNWVLPSARSFHSPGRWAGDLHQGAGLVRAELDHRCGHVGSEHARGFGLTCAMR